MERIEIETKSVEETLTLGKQLGERLFAGAVVTLAGDLGAGKTHFAKGVAAGLGVTRTVNSPTFTIVKEYEGRLPLYHLDVYRLNEEESEELGLEEYFEGSGVSLVEWAERVEDQLPREYLAIDIRRSGETARHFTLTPRGERYLDLSKELETL
ncbi:tRNA (adenosine(37)-N6)-threonylcarbamoyltransferase complex ATPase subunit type 1 TsaE [Salsuginibacillus kocurii]|uniref:tRNA (adenosine(37)-N6)-threonylcarbamoyltransferase complex ATPase subunit type 1 TsaE n=1 Tax=Salsuginibacillus kocurii TaxID=427078 RepID=UPI0003720F2D|nr:tRNA (adenosine(37)-N6)-threonylcarbamoyltransferase complex ATPase subunit type 1 TsaE [Salsuginibacillus kocurii]